MSGRAAPPAPNRHSPRLAKSLLVLSLLAGLAAHGAAQDGPDDKPPLPPDEPKRAQAAAKFQVENRDRAIFRGRRDAKGNLLPNTGIVDFEPFASERDNKDEYDAWTEVTQHAAQFTAAELEEHAGRDLTRKDLEKLPYRFRLDLVRFDGKLTKVRRVAAAKSLKDAGLAEVYEAVLVPLGEPPTEAVWVVFTELPAALAAVRQAPENEWVPVGSLEAALAARSGLWASAAGYFFKLKQDAPKTDAFPVLIGKSVTVRKESPSGPDKNHPAALDKDLRVFRLVRDNAPIAKEEDNWEEVAAWNRVLLHARRFTPEELEANARTDLTFYDLFKDTRRDYKLDLVKFEGRLISLKKMEPSKKLRDAGVETAFEGWLVPKDEPSGNPIAIVFTDVPEGVEPTGRVNKWVSFAGYSFKLLQYESGERDRADPKKNVWKKAPLLLGRAIVARPDPEAASNVSWQSFATVATAVVLVLLGTALGLTWWFRRGDRRARREIDAHRATNPFGGN